MIAAEGGGCIPIGGPIKTIVPRRIECWFPRAGRTSAWISASAGGGTARSSPRLRTSEGTISPTRSHIQTVVLLPPRPTTGRCESRPACPQRLACEGHLAKILRIEQGSQVKRDVGIEQCRLNGRNLLPLRGVAGTGHPWNVGSLVWVLSLSWSAARLVLGGPGRLAVGGPSGSEAGARGSAPGPTTQRNGRTRKLGVWATSTEEARSK
ncbi:hypothetical protein THAOC_11530, partial [Thalassiosira oceanica]